MLVVVAQAEIHRKPAVRTPLVVDVERVDHVVQARNRVPGGEVVLNRVRRGDGRVEGRVGGEREAPVRILAHDRVAAYDLDLRAELQSMLTAAGEVPRERIGE